MFNDKELSLIKNTFADNDELIYTIRKVLLQFPITEAEEKLLLTSISPEVYAVIKKRVYPDVDPEAPMFQIADMYQSLTQPMNGKGVEEMAPLFDAKELEIDYLEQQFGVLKDISTHSVGDKTVKIKLDDLKILKGKDAYTRYVHTMARNYLLTHVDSFLNHLKVLAGQKNETVDQAKKRLERDSSK